VLALSKRVTIREILQMWGMFVGTEEHHSRNAHITVDYEPTQGWGKGKLLKSKEERFAYATWYRFHGSWRSKTGVGTSSLMDAGCWAGTAESIWSELL
jgi:hypothetical protein